ncbi:MAG: hypothetical protein Q9173_001611 [Seirophora scorigena]
MLKQSTLPLDQSTSLPEQSTLLVHASSSHAKAPSPGPAASPPQPKAQSPMPTRKRKPVALPSADPGNEESATDNLLHPPKRGRGRPKGSTKASQAEKLEAAGPIKKRVLRSQDKSTPPYANKAPHKRGRPKKSETGNKTPTAGTSDQEAGSEAVDKTVSGVGVVTHEMNDTVGKTDGIKKRGRPKKSGVGMESNATGEAKKATINDTAEVKKRGRPKKTM